MNSKYKLLISALLLSASSSVTAMHLPKIVYYETKEKCDAECLQGPCLDIKGKGFMCYK